MSTYCPERWVILRITSSEFGTVDKVFAGWYGGYTSGDSWKMSSGIVSFSVENNNVSFVNLSGSIYNCYINDEGMSGYMTNLYNSFTNDLPENTTVEIIKFENYKALT